MAGARITGYLTWHWCTSHNKEYLLVVFPGYSYSIADGAKPLNEMPRWGGDFLWRQFYKSIDAGVQMLYIAMFDEVDEGTAIYKVSNNPPPDLPFIVYREDLPGQGRNYVPAGASTARRSLYVAHRPGWQNAQR